MRVILLVEVKGLGKKFEIKEVSDGYAKNVLIPKKLAQLATPQDIQKLAAQKALWEKQAAEEKIRLTGIKEDLHKKEIVFHVKTGAKNEVFGSVTTDMIKNALREQGIGVEKVLIPKALKTIGTHEVEVLLGMGVAGVVRITLTK